jgi:DNA polymerase III epsilon subunit-like protein
MSAPVAPPEHATVVVVDTETTIPEGAVRTYDLLEFACIRVSLANLAELGAYSTLVRSSRVTARSEAANHISAAMVAQAPAFAEVAPMIYGLLHGRIWVGHNVVKFDHPRIAEAFDRAGLEPPVPRAMVDTLLFARHHFRGRAVSQKLGDLAAYFGIDTTGCHRALADCRLCFRVYRSMLTVRVLECEVREATSCCAAAASQPP